MWEGCGKPEGEKRVRGARGRWLYYRHSESILKSQGKTSPFVTVVLCIENLVLGGRPLRAGWGCANRHAGWTNSGWLEDG